MATRPATRPTPIPAPAPPVISTRALLAEAVQLLERFDRPDLAAELAGRILVAEPDNAAALLVAGLSAHMLGDPDTAAVRFEAAIEVMPSDPTPRRLRANLLSERGHATDAAEELQSARELFPTDPDIAAALGAAYVECGQVELALDAYRAAATLDPAATGPRKSLVLLDMASGALAEATTTYRELLALDGQDPASHLVQAGRFTTVADWCAAHIDAGAHYRTVLPPCPDVIYPPAYVGEPRPDPIPLTRPETYVAQIPEATVVGGESFVLAPDGAIVWDIAVTPDSARFDLAERVTRYAQGGVALIDATSATSPRIEAAIDLAGVSSFNYFHWLVEFLARFANLEAAPELDTAQLPLLVDRAVTAVPQLMAALAAIAGPDRSIIALDPGTAYRVGRLVLPSQLSWMPNNLRDGEDLEIADFYVSAAAIDFLRGRLAPGGTKAAGPGHRRVYLLKSVGSRRLLNGAELEAVLPEFGVEVVHPERLDFEEQIRLFADAKLVIAESGAALTNLLFCPPRARVVVLVAERWNAGPYSQIAGVLGQEMVFVTGMLRERHYKTYQSGFSIDPADLRRALAVVAPPEARP
jgi:capsular polysaccharide biosynthesis protein